MITPPRPLCHYLWKFCFRRTCWPRAVVPNSHGLWFPNPLQGSFWDTNLPLLPPLSAASSGISTPAYLHHRGCSGRSGLSLQAHRYPVGSQAFPGAFTLEILPKGARPRNQLPLIFSPAPSELGEGECGCPSPLAHIFQPFGEKASLSRSKFQRRDSD